MTVVLNPSPMDEKLLRCDLSKVSIFIMNEVEAKAICGFDSAEKAIEVLHKKYPNSKIVITLGGDGSVYFDGTKIYRRGIYKVNAVDTTCRRRYLYRLLLKRNFNRNVPGRNFKNVCQGKRYGSFKTRCCGQYSF